MLPYSGDSYITLVGIFLLAIPIFFVVKKSSLILFQEWLWDEITQKRSHLSLMQEAHELTNHTYNTVDHRWQNAKTRLRGTLNKCKSGYNAKFAFTFLSVLSSFIFIFSLSQLFLVFYYSNTNSIKAADAMLMMGEIVLIATIIAEVYCYSIRKELESPRSVILYSLLAAMLAVLCTLAWAKWFNYCHAIGPNIARNIYFAYTGVPVMPFVVYGIHTCYIFIDLHCRFYKLKKAVKEFKDLECLLKNGKA